MLTRSIKVTVKRTVLTLKLPGGVTIMLTGRVDVVWSISVSNVLRELIACDLTFPEGCMKIIICVIQRKNKKKHFELIILYASFSFFLQLTTYIQ